MSESMQKAYMTTIFATKKASRINLETLFNNYFFFLRKLE